MHATVVRPITLHYVERAGRTLTIAPGTLVEVLERQAGLVRIRCAATSDLGSLVDEDKLAPDTADADVSLPSSDERTA